MSAVKANGRKPHFTEQALKAQTWMPPGSNAEQVSYREAWKGLEGSTVASEEGVRIGRGEQVTFISLEFFTKMDLCIYFFFTI